MRARVCTGHLVSRRYVVVIARCAGATTSIGHYADAVIRRWLAHREGSPLPTRLDLLGFDRKLRRKSAQRHHNKKHQPLKKLAHLIKERK
jgi:hypothetical protein